MSVEEVERMAASIAADVLKLEDRTIAALLPSLLEAREDLHRGLAEWLSRVDGRERFTAQHYRRGLASIEAALETIANMRPELQARIHAATQQSATLAAAHVREELIQFSTAFQETIRPTQISTAGVIAHTEHEIIPRIRTSSARYVQAVREDMRHQFAMGLASGETFEQLTNRLRRLGGPRGLVALRGIAGEPGAHVEEIAEGLFNRYRHWAERIVRTEVINAYNVQHVAAIEQINDDQEHDDEELVLRWDATPDKRLCPRCRELDGKTAKVGKPFPGGVLRPPAHPNCRCVAVAWHRSWGEREERAEPPATDKKNPKRVAAAKKAAAASAERRREIHSAVKSNLPQELHVAWDQEGHKFMREEAGRIRGTKDRINAASKLSEAFAEKYGSGEQTVFGNEGDRFNRRAEIEAKHAEKWADEQERKYYEAAYKDALRKGEIDANGKLTNKPPDDDDPPF